MGLRAWLRRLLGVEQLHPPRGTRPQVRLEYEDVTYDLTDDLERIDDDSQGRAVWQIHGPLHLRMSKPPSVLLRQPLPAQTTVALHLITGSGHARFASPEEIVRDREEGLIAKLMGFDPQ